MKKIISIFLCIILCIVLGQPFCFANEVPPPKLIVDQTDSVINNVEFLISGSIIPFATDKPGKIQYKLNSGTWIEIPCESSNKFSTVITLNKEGSNEIRVRPVDALNNIGAISIINVTVKVNITVTMELNNPVMKVSTGSDTENVVLDVAPAAPNGRTLVPVRAISEAFGAQVGWDAATSQATIIKDATTIILTLGSNTAVVNGSNVTLDEKAQSINGRTVVPLRFISESMGYNVGWDGNSKTITITQK